MPIPLFLRLLCLFAAIPFFAAAEAPKPNILLILADDLGFSDLGCYGGEIATPNLDSLAENGLRFTQFYNTARCWPTRGALLTGFYAQQIRRDNLPGIPSGGGNTGIRPDWAKLLPELLAPVGYRSYHTGKWHIDGMPVENGFDRSYYVKDQGRFFNPARHFKDDKQLPPVEKNSGYYATTALADHAIEVLEEHAAKHADQPFFEYLAFAAPHFPLQALPEDIEIYKDTYDVGWDVVRQRRWKNIQEMGLFPGDSVTALSRVERDLGPPYHFPKALEILGKGEINRPVPWRSLTEVQKKFQADKMAIHAAMIHRMDIEIGRVFDQIKKMGEWDNTLVMFLSDNGASAEIMVRDDGHDPDAPPGSAATYLCLGPGWSTTSNTPFRRHKTWTHEGGVSTPLLMSWPNGIEVGGVSRHEPGHVIDIVPTVIELAGADYATDAPPPPGKSFVSLFPAEIASPGPKTLWWFHDGHKAIRISDWKAVAPMNQPWELYDFSTDREESTDLAIVNPEKLEELVAAWDAQLEASIELASRDLTAEQLKKQKAKSSRPNHMKSAQAEAQPPSHQVLVNGESFLLTGRRAFLMEAKSEGENKPWIFYGPTLDKYPDKAENWMHQQFIDAGVSVAGINVGEAYGSPQAFPFFEALYQEMVSRGYSKRPALLGRSRGGLWVSSWALEHPDRVAGIGGIYPVYDFTSYPGVEKAASVYGLTGNDLLELNPIKRAAILAKAKIPVFIIHGIDDKVVPLEKNSAALEKVYEEVGAGDLIEVVKVDGQGHNFWPGFFTHQTLVDFLISQAKGEQ